MMHAIALSAVLQAVQGAPTIASQNVDLPSSGELLGGGGLAYMVAHGLDILRRSGFITNAKQHRLFALLAAFGGAAGLKLTFDWGTGDGTIHFTVLGILNALLHSGSVYAGIDYLYKVAGRIQLDKFFEVPLVPQMRTTDPVAALPKL